jgi:iron complex outermembrane receptor protein
VGSDNQRTLEGVVNGGGEKIAVRGSFLTESRDGFIDNLATGETAGDLEREAARLQVLFKPTEDFDALLKLHRRKHDGNGNNGSLIIGTYNAGTPIAYTRPDGRVIENAVYQDEEILHEGASLTLNKGFGGITLTSITSYDNTDNFVLGGGGNNPLENHTRSRSDISWEQFTQELRLSSSDQQRLRWIAGAHLFREQLDSDVVAARYQQSLAQLPAPLVAQSAATPGFRNTVYDHETESAGIYGNIAFDFTEQFTVTAGLRWSTEKKDLQIALRQYNLVDFTAGSFWEESSLAGNPTPDVDQARSLSETWKDWSWDLTPEYRFNDNLRGFFRYARGFRSGGLNVGVQASLDPVRAVEPEYVDSYEIGIKSEWLDERLIVNANVFYYDYEDIQTNLLVPNPAGGITSALANGPEARAQGLELEIDGLITDNLRGRLAAAYLDSEYKQFINRNPITGEITGDNSGNRLVRSPRVTIGAGLEHTLNLGNGSKVITGGDISYRGREFFLVDRQDPAADPSLTQAGYTVANARVTYVAPEGNIRVTAFVNNLTDKFYQVHGRPNGPAPLYVETYGNPRTYGLSFTYEY